MRLLIELSMECESLARAEALAGARALGGEPLVVCTNRGTLVMETEADPLELASRLGLCHFVDEWLGSCEPSELEKCAEDIEIEGPIRVRSTKVGDLRINLADASRRLGRILAERGGVDLHHPRSDIRAVFTDTVHIGRVLASVDRPSFEKRKNRYMPFVYPASLHPKFARAMVNLTEVPKGGRLLDPFCGTGAIVAEASMLGMEAIGTDFSERMIEGARRNLTHLGLRGDLALCDVGEIPRIVGEVDGIATDPPYGRSTSTKGESISALYRRAFAAFAGVLQRGARAVVAVPRPALLDNIDSFRLIDKHPLWVHRSLTRNFCVLERV